MEKVSFFPFGSFLYFVPWRETGRVLFLTTYFFFTNGQNFLKALGPLALARDPGVNLLSPDSAHITGTGEQWFCYNHLH